MRLVRLVAVMLFTSVTTIVFGTQYTFTGDGAWTNSSNWEGGIVAPSYITAGDIVIIKGNALFGTYFIDCPTGDCLDFGGGNLGKIVIETGASLTLKFDTQFASEGIIEVYGTLINKSIFEGYNTQNVTIWGLFKNQYECGNQGTITIKNGGTLDNSSQFDNAMFVGAEGTLILEDGGTINNIPPAIINLGTITGTGGTIINSTVLKGNAIITGNLNNSGTLAPGASPGKYEVTGDYIASTTAIHNFEVGGTAAGLYDVLNVDGVANLNGDLNITLINGFTPADAHEIPIITGVAIIGVFQNVNIPATYQLLYQPNQVVLKSLVPLPVTFVSLEAKTEATGLKLTWQVFEEENVLRYGVEKSKDGKDYTKIGFVDAARLTSYSFIDTHPETKTYYRVKSVDIDGKFKYSTVIRTNQNEASVILKVFPLPATEGVVVQHKTARINSRITITTIDGKLIRTILPQKNTQQTSIKFSGMNAGIYILRFEDEFGNCETTKIIKQ